MNLEQLLSKKIITRKEFKEAGFSDYEVKKLVDKGLLIKTSRGVYESTRSNDHFFDLVTKFNNHDSEAVARIYDQLQDKEKYHSDLIKLMLVSISRIENALSNGYILKKENEQLSAVEENKKEKIDNTSDISHLDSTNDIVCDANDNLELAKEEIKDDKEENNFDINLFLDNLYCEYRNAIEVGNFYKARDILLEYERYCNEYRVYNDCFKHLFKLTNKIESFSLENGENEEVGGLIRELENNFVKGKFRNDSKSVKDLLKKFKAIPNFNDIYYYHEYSARYLVNIKMYDYAIKEYENAIEINPYNKYDYYNLAFLYFVRADSKEKIKKSLKYINSFSYYNNNQFTPNQLSLLVNIYIFNFRTKEALDIIEEVKHFDEDYQNKFFSNLISIYMKKYESLEALQKSGVEFKQKFASTFIENECIDLFNDYIHSIDCNCEDLVNSEDKKSQEFICAKEIIDSSSVTKLSELDNYLFGFDLYDENVLNLLLDVAIYLAEKGFGKKSYQYLKIVEKIKDKSKDLKDNYREAQNKIKIRINANKNRR